MDGVQHQLSRRVARSIGVALLCVPAACGGDAGAARAAPPSIVDSILPRDVALARFRAALVEVVQLDGGARSRDALVRRFVQALEHTDTVTLTSLRLTRAEFAWLYYPTNPQGLPPYNLPPGLMWELLSVDSDKGLRRALTEFGGRVLRYEGYSCDPRESRQGDNTVAGPCTVRLEGTTQRLFGLVVEREGVHKFLSYSNKL